MKFLSPMVVGLASLGFLLASQSSADDFVRTGLSGFQEVPPVSNGGDGRFRLRRTNRSFTYEMEYDLEDEIRFAHIHFAPEGVNGGIMVWLCDNPELDPGVEPPLDTPDCVGTSGTVVGVLSADDVVGPEGQGIEPGALREVRRAVLRGLTYVNVHSVRFPGGELRGQIEFDDDRDEDLEDRLSDLEHDFENHAHTYRTGRGGGHNNTEASTGKPE